MKDMEIDDIFSGVAHDGPKMIDLGKYTQDRLLSAFCEKDWHYGMKVMCDVLHDIVSEESKLRDALVNSVCVGSRAVLDDIAVTRFGFVFCERWWNVVGFQFGLTRVGIGTYFGEPGTGYDTLRAWDGEYCLKTVAKTCADAAAKLAEVRGTRISKGIKDSFVKAARAAGIYEETKENEK